MLCLPFFMAGGRKQYIPMPPKVQSLQKPLCLLLKERKHCVAESPAERLHSLAEWCRTHLESPYPEKVL